MNYDVRLAEISWYNAVLVHIDFEDPSFWEVKLILFMINIVVCLLNTNVLEHARWVILESVVGPAVNKSGYM